MNIIDEKILNLRGIIECMIENEKQDYEFSKTINELPDLYKINPRDFNKINIDEINKLKLIIKTKSSYITKYGKIDLNRILPIENHNVLVFHKIENYIGTVNINKSLKEKNEYCIRVFEKSERFACGNDLEIIGYFIENNAQPKVTKYYYDYSVFTPNKRKYVIEPDGTVNRI